MKVEASAAASWTVSASHASHATHSAHAEHSGPSEKGLEDLVGIHVCLKEK